MTFRTIRAGAALGSLLAAGPLAVAEQVVISEILYHPKLDNQPEYLELYNNTATPFDIALWSLTDGVTYRFPDFDPANPDAGFLKPFERVVLAGADAATTRSAYGIPATVRIFGPWQGDLANDGERITLQDKNGVIVCTVQYNDRGKWSPAADGAGHSLVLRSPNRSVDDWRNWTVSSHPGGTPGTEPIAAAETPVTNPEVNLSSGIAVVDYGDVWKYHDQNLDLGTAWRSPSYNDSGWPEGPGLFGFEESALPPPGLRTPFNDVNQVTFYLRKKFVYGGSLESVVVTVDQVLDDGAVYYLNGQELGRSGMAAGVSGFTATANRTVSDAVEELNVFPVNASLLIAGTNTLAVEAHQTGPSSSDIVFGMRLSVAAPVQSQSGLVINEVLPGPAEQGFIEFYNPLANGVDLAGFFLTDTVSNLTRHRIDGSLVVPPGGFASVGFAEAGLALTNPVVVYLVAPDGASIENGISATIPPDGRSLGRKPAGGTSWFLFTEPTRDAANESQESLAGLVKLNEVHFSPSNTVDWVELFNVSDTPQGLEGLYLSARRDFADRVPLTGTLTARSFASRSTGFPLADNETTLYLINSANTVLDCRRFTRLDGRDSLQAFPDGAAEWYSAATGTPDAANDPPRNTDIVINEIMYDPPSDQLDGEFIELHNRGAVGVDVSGWRFTDGPRLTLPSGTIIPACGYLVCAANAARLRAVYGAIPVVGDFEGRLANRGELVRLVDQHDNLVDEVDYTFGGDWPELAHGSGSSLELVHPALDNRLPSAWRDSNEANKAPFKTYTVTDTYRQLNSLGGVTDYRELHLHLANDGYAIVQNIALRQGGTGSNLILNGTVQSTTGSGANGWLCQGTHATSFVNNGQLHLIADGHGDNRANRAEIDVTGLTANTSVTLSFEARWVHGTPRLIAQTWDHTVGQAFRLEIPENLGTPGAVNSTFQTAPPPQVENLMHSPPVPRSTEDVRVTARVLGASSISAVQLWHRADNANGDAAWSGKPMYDDGVNGGDAVADDGVYTATLTEHNANGRVVQFYVEATAQNGQSRAQPRHAGSRPAMYVVDDRSIARDLRTARFVVSAFDLDAISNGETAKHDYRYPRLSNHYKNMTFISNEEEVRYAGLIRNSGSPWTRGGDLSRGKWKLPEDREFRGHVKFTFDNDPTAGRMHHNRITRYWLYLLGHPVNENEFIRVMINAGSPALREDTEPVAKDMMDRLFENGRQGELYRIDDEWWFRDDWQRTSRNADWSYKASENPVRYHTEWMKRTTEDDYDYSTLIDLFRTISTVNYTQAQIERLVDAEATLMMAAVRGYIGDWDSFTLNRGKNGYMYRRWSDGKLMFLHWDSDLAFQNSNETLYNSGRPGIGPYISRQHNLRRFYHYLAELVDKYTLNSPRINAWLQAEEEASTSFVVSSSFYQGWFSSRASYARNQMGTNYQRPFEITTNAGQPVNTAENTISLAGFAPYPVFEIEIEHHPEALVVWNSLNSWTASGIVLRSGVNVLNVRGIDQSGNVVREAPLTVNKTGSAPPVMSLNSDPNSWHLAVDQSLELDARNSFDPEGTALTYTWTPPAELAHFDPSLPGRATAGFIRPGLYAFTAQGTDTEGQQSDITREAAVYGTDGFSPFSDVRLEEYWGLRHVDYRWNYPGGAWFSLSDVPGWLALQVLDDAARPLTSQQPPYPLIWRALPTGGDWVLQTKLRLASRQFGNYITGLHLEAVETGTTYRYVFGIENGTALAAKRVAANGTITSLANPSLEVDELAIRIRRVGDILWFEERRNEVWNTVASHPLAIGAATEAGGLFLATTLAQSIRVHFDYAMLIDPSDTSDLRQHLRISEIMYHPVGGEQFEFVELVNTGPATLDLTGCQFIAGIDFTFGPTLLGPGEQIVLVNDPDAFAARYGTSGIRIADGVFTGRLDNAGERLTLVDAQGNIILSFSYKDSGDWPGRADGLGSSLEIVNPQGNYDDPRNWNSSAEYLGSPGSVGVGKFPSIVINEVLTHSDPPLEDAVELHNPTGLDVDIGGWYLSDDAAALKKYRIPAPTVIPAGAYRVFYEYQFNDTNNPAIMPFALNSYRGDDLWLTAANAAGDLTFFIDHVDFGAAENGISFGRHPDGAGPLVTMSRRTFGADDPSTIAEFRSGQGAANAYPSVGPVVINQIMYNPATGGDEHLELLNITDADVPFHDPLHPTNTWHFGSGIDYQFPTNVVLAAGGRLFVVPIDPAVFRTRHGVPPDVQVFGPWIGALDNGGERIDLLKPDPPNVAPPDAGLVPYILVEAVRYNNREPWPTLADGLGPPLERRVPSNYGNDPANWFTDFDQDGIPDDWEVHYLLSPFYAGDADLDFDGDGFTNREEYLNGTDPRVPDAMLEIIAWRLESDALVFEFHAAADRTYSVLVSDDLAQGVWSVFSDIPAEPNARTVVTSSPLIASGPIRFFRIVTPQIP